MRHLPTMLAFPHPTTKHSKVAATMILKLDFD